MSEKKLYPIGSLVTLKNATKPVMIAAISYQKDGIRYDYLGIPYPMGYIDKNLTIIFNNEDIKEINFYGYKDYIGDKYLKEESNK